MKVIFLLLVPILVFPSMDVLMVFDALSLSPVVNIDFLKTQSFDMGIATDMTKAFIVYIEKDFGIYDYKFKAGGFLGTSRGNFSVGLTLRFDSFKYNAVLSGFQVFLGRDFSVVGPFIGLNL